MTTTHLVLNDISYVLPDGRTLFSSLCEQFDSRATGLVGRNGVGKTVLARILAGHRLPSAGTVRCSGRAHYVAQQVGELDGATVAALAGVKDTLDAVARIEAGSTALEDFDAVGDRWDIRQRLCAELDLNNLGYLDPEMPADGLSGGESMRLSLIRASFADADFLILDEPSNHLDRANRQALIEQLQRWSRGLIVISHDRQLLETMERIVELSFQGLRNYGGNYSFYADAKVQAQRAAQNYLAERKLERRRQTQAMRKEVERQERRQARGNRHGKQANQAKILLDRQQERSEASSGNLRRKQAAHKVDLDQRVREASKQVHEEAAITLHDVAASRSTRRNLVELEDVTLPYVTVMNAEIDLVISRQQRIGVTGSNGSGKSTLLRVISGQLAPVTGTASVIVENAHLDQRLANLDPEKTLFEQLRLANRYHTESHLRMRLKQLGLGEQEIAVPTGELSGGERMKGALACLLYADTPPQLLLLDEPSNHLDLSSVQALETVLRNYGGALVVVSHDDVFLHKLELTDILTATGRGWSLETL